jgi:hypothetical protein
MPSTISFAGSAAALALLAVSCAGCPRPEVHALVAGVVIDANTQRPVAGVEIISHGQTATTDAAGHYVLAITGGVRELTIVPPDGRPLRKYVVARDASDLRLDVLVPPPGESPTPSLLLQRGYWSDSENENLPLDAGNRALVSGVDAFGNGDTFFAPASGHSVESPVWAPAGDAFYFSDVAYHVHHDDPLNYGLKRFDPSSGKTTNMWFDETSPHTIAVAPDGDALVAASSSGIYMFEGLLGARPSHRLIPIGVNWVAWGPSEEIYASMLEMVGPATHRSRMTRLWANGQTRDGTFLEDASRPLPLADGGLVYYYDGRDVEEPLIRLREPDGTTRDLMRGNVFPAAFDRAANALTYRLGDELHRRDLGTGLDLVIVQAVAFASVKPTPRP